MNPVVKDDLIVSTEEGIEAALTILERLQADPVTSPAVVVMPPDTEDFIIGNAAGFVRLAIASLKAAKGNTQSFEGEPWWRDYEEDWEIKGLKPDPLAHMYLPPAPTPAQQLWSKVWGYGVMAVLVSCLAVGFIMILNWVTHFPGVLAHGIGLR